MRGRSVRNASAFASRYAGSCSTAVEVALCGRRQIGAALNTGQVSSESVVVTEPGGEPKGSSLNQVIRRYVACEKGLGFSRALPQVLSRGQPQFPSNRCGLYSGPGRSSGPPPISQ